jgi:hypothetical protein
MKATSSRDIIDARLLVHHVPLLYTAQHVIFYRDNTKDQVARQNLEE